MAGNRRKIFYVDRVFQNKFLLLFLSLSTLGVVGNIIYLTLYLKTDLEDHLYRARITISNVNEIIIQSLFYFNLALVLIVAALAIIFYYLIKRNLRRFFDRVKNILVSGRGKGSLKEVDFLVPEEFQELSGTLKNFFDYADRRLTEEKEILRELRQFVLAPDEKSRQALIEKMGRL